MQTFAITALLALASTAYSASCVKQVQGGGIFDYVVTGDNVPDIPGICGGLWDNLKGFAGCAAPSNTYCGTDDVTGELQWKFRVVSACDGGSVQSVWYDATKNNYGSISCP